MSPWVKRDPNEIRLSWFERPSGNYILYTSKQTLNMSSKFMCSVCNLHGITPQKAWTEARAANFVRESTLGMKIKGREKKFSHPNADMDGVIGSLDILVCPGHVRTWLSGCNFSNEPKSACYACEHVNIFWFLSVVNVKRAFLYVLFLHI
jgi:hypothetical protein